MDRGGRAPLAGPLSSLTCRGAHRPEGALRGQPRQRREKDFVSFLGEHFQKVGTAHYSKFTEADAKGYDVVLFDWTSIYPRDEDGKIKEKIDRLNSPTAPKLPEDFDRPSILIGAAGGFLAQPLRLKIDWR